MVCYSFIVSKIEFGLVTLLRVGPLHPTIELRPGCSSPHDRHGAGDVLVQRDVTGIWREPLIVPPFPAAARQGWIEPPEFVQHARREAGIDQIVSVPRALLCPLVTVWAGPTPESVQFDVEFVGDRLVPRLEKRFEVRRQRALRPNFLVAPARARREPCRESKTVLAASV